MSHLQADHIRKARAKRKAKAFRKKVERENRLYDQANALKAKSERVVLLDVPAPWEGPSMWE